ncbi:MAG: pyridoxal-phosphate dependent enzyme, partial [Clostridiales bacterium]|nr:pyridoxal-phosphate dependent enzyme [Clostridiales bacterium]
MRIYKSVTELIGRTPLLEPSNYELKNKLKARLLVKLEYLNPTGSVKDRTAKYMIESAERVGIVKAGTTIIEPTSGNTGIGLAAIAAAKNCRLIVTMPESMSEERRNLLKAYGAEIVLTPASEGMRGAIKKAQELNAEIRGSIIAGQFENPANPK